MSVELNVLAPVTDMEQRMLDEAAATGWVFSLEQLRESRQRGPNGLLVAQRLLKAGAVDSLSAAEELALVEECWRAGGVWLLEELARDRLRASRALVDVWEEANEPAGEVAAGPARLVRVAFSRVLSVSGDPIVDKETGFTIEWVGLDICHDRLFEAPPGWVPRSARILGCGCRMTRRRALGSGGTSALIVPGASRTGWLTTATR